MFHMANEAVSIDPQQAWSPYEPISSAGWTLPQVAHLYRRAGFSATYDALVESQELTPQVAVQQLMDRSEQSANEFATVAKNMLATGSADNLSAWWIYRLLRTNDPLREKMTVFWHGHFATSAEKVTDPRLMYQQNELFREHSLGDFSVLLHDVSQDPAMLLYLDSATNRKAHPNENFAREIMELFCLGEGNYTERDIRELARCFTGWEVRAKRFRFNRYQHDRGEKTIFGQSGPFDGNAGVDLVLAESAGPEFICGKLIKFFVLDEVEPSSELILPLAREFRENGLQIGPIVTRILASRLFYSRQAIGRKIRSPLEFAIGLLRSLEASTNTFELAKRMESLGQKLFFPPNVKGWEGGRTWINSATLLARANLLRDLLDAEQTRFAGGGMTDLCDKHDLQRPDEIVAWLEAILFAVELNAEVRNKLVRSLETGTDSREQRLRNLIYLMGTLPEIHLG